MQVIIYSPNPKIKPIVLKVEKDKWEGNKYHSIDDKDLPRYLVWYMADTSGKRMLEVEFIIKKSPFFSAAYADLVIGKRWPEVEEAIMKDPMAAFVYARDVIKGRWKIAEKFIKDSDWWRYYKKTFKCK